MGTKFTQYSKSWRFYCSIVNRRFVSVFSFQVNQVKGTLLRSIVAYLICKMRAKDRVQYASGVVKPLNYW